MIAGVVCAAESMADRRSIELECGKVQVAPWKGEYQVMRQAGAATIEPAAVPQAMACMGHDPPADQDRHHRPGQRDRALNDNFFLVHGWASLCV